MLLQKSAQVWESFIESVGLKRRDISNHNTRRARRKANRKRNRLAAVVELLEDRTLLAAPVDTNWQQIEPQGSLVYEQEFAGSSVQTIYSEDFESGSLGAEWTTYSSVPQGRVGVTNVLGTPANSGDYHLAMDSTTPGVSALNEAILTLDLSGQTEVELSFFHKDVNDEDLALPGTFSGHAFGDGVSISADGVTWHTLTSLNNANSPNNVYTEFSFDLDQAAANAGISLGSNFQIKFQQFDNFPFNTDGRAYDDIRITSVGPDTTTVFLEGGQTLTTVATPDDPAATLTIEVYDTTDTLIASATASAPGEAVDLQTIAIPTDGDYDVVVISDVVTDFELSLFRNATVEVVDTADGLEQDATGSFIELGSGRWGIVGEFTPVEGDDSEIERPIVWGIQPATGDILKIDPTTGDIIDTFAVPDALAPTDRINGLSIAEEGDTLIYVNGDILYRLDPDDGTVLSTETLPGFGPNRGGLSFESGSTDFIFAIDDGGPVDRQAGYSGALADWTPGGASFPGGLGGDDNGRLFVYRLGQIQEFSTTVANTQLNAFALPPGASDAQGLAFDGVHLYVSDNNGNLFTLDPDTGAVLNQVLVVGGALTGLGADIVGGGGTLSSGPIYTTQQNGTRLGTIDTTTGAGTDIGPFGTTQTWAAAFGTDGTLYTTINGFSGNAILASVNQTTGAITTIGTGLGTNLISLEVAADGTMYGIGYNNRILYEIDETTGVGTAIGDTGISGNMDLAFDSAGVMYATVGNNIWTVDLATAASTLLGSFSGIASGQIMGIMFDHTDTLFATAYIPNSPLYEIDLNTLAATQIGSTGFNAPHGGDIFITSSGIASAGTQAIVPAATPDIYGDPGEPGRFPPGPAVPAQQTLAGTELLVNGSFETGNFSGWTTVTTGGPFRPWAVTGSGQGGGFGMLQTQPQDGTFVAWNGFDGGGPMEFQMFQDVTIAADATDATLSWMDRIQWNFTLGQTATLPRLYDVEIRDPNTNAVLASVYSFSTGTQATNPTGNTGWQVHSADLSAFAGQTVRIFFREQIPQPSTGPAQIEFDAISLVVDAGVQDSEDMYAAIGRGSPVNPGALILVDQATGAGTLVGDTITPGGMTGLDFDSEGRLWGSSIDGPLGNRTSELVEIDPADGSLISSVAVTYLGQAISLGDLAIQPGTDVIYGVHSNSDATAFPGGLIFTIDRATGEATLVGNTFQNRNGGLAFEQDGSLWFLEFNQLHELNPVNAAILSTTNLDFGGHDGLGIRPSDGVFFASRAGAGTLGDEIRIIDPVAGTSTLIGQTGVGNASDLAFLVTKAEAAPDIDEYTIDLEGGRVIDIVFTGLEGTDEGGASTNYSQSLTQQNNVFAPNVLNFDFNDAVPPAGDATLKIDAIADLNGTNEFLSLDAEGLFAQDIFVTGGLQQQPISTTITIPQAVLAQLAADGTISFTVTPSLAVNNLGPNSLTLELSYEAVSTESGALVELLDTDGTTVLATAQPGADNYSQGILDFVVPTDGTYTIRLTSEEAGRYSVVVTDKLVFDTEPNSPSLILVDEGFESGSLGSEWTTSSSTPQGRILVSDTLGAPTQSGTFHLIMDRDPAGAQNLNEAILTVDLSGLENVELSFWHKDVNDEDTALPASFVGSALGDGVSISEDGVTWHTLTSFNNANSPNNVYTQFAFDLTAAADAAGISLGPNFQIKFQQYDNFPLNTDGRTFDGIQITAANTLRSLDDVDGALGYLTGFTDSGVDLGLMQSFESLTIADSGFIPPDPIIAAGPDVVVGMVNTDIVIHDKNTGAVVAQADLDGVGGFWATSNIVFDPWIVYDPDSERFFAIGIDRTTSGAGSSRVYLAVSTDSTPTNLTTDWNKYIINRTGTHTVSGGSTFPDYPKLGVNDDAIFITGNDFGILGGGFSHVSLFAIEKAPLLSGGAANIVYDEVVTSAFSVHPVINYDNDGVMYFAEAVGTTGIRLHAINDVLTSPVRTTTIVTVPTFNFPPDVPQQGGLPLDSVSQRIMSGVVRDGSLWTAHAIQDPAVDAETVVRWYEFDITNFASASLVQSGNVDPGVGIHTWMAHINVDNDGDMGIAFSISGPNQFAGIAYTGRLASDPLGTTRDIEIARTGEGSYQLFDGIGRNRWGDYSGLAVDPDGESFWLYNEYAGAGNTWRTFVGQFQVEPGSADPDLDGYSITLLAGETITLSTETPFDSPIDGLNLLDPSLEIYDPLGDLVAFDTNGALDGKNAVITAFTAAISGMYKVVVKAETDGAGEYVLDVNYFADIDDDSLVLSDTEIDENGITTLSGTYSDRNMDDTHTVEVNWDDPNSANDTFALLAAMDLTVGDTFNSSTSGAVLTVTGVDVATGEVSFEVSHQYLDDGVAPGNNTASDMSFITVTVTDSAGGSDTSDGPNNAQEFVINGDFETGDFTGWTVLNTGSGAWTINDGTLNPAGPGTALPAISGSFDALVQQGGGGIRMLSESFVVPDGITAATLSFSDRIRNFASVFSDPNQEWRVELVDASDVLIQEIFSTNPGDPLQQIGPNNRSFDLTSLLQSLSGQTVALRFVEQDNLFYFNVNLDDVSLVVESGDPLKVTVNNLDPVITGFTNSAELNNKAAEGDTVTIAADFTDVGTLDVHTATIDWGDGNVTNATITQGAGFGSLSGDHVYANGGIYTVTVTLSDDDTGTDSFETTVAVTGVGLTSDGILQIVGTSGDDVVTVNQVDGSLMRVHADFLTDPGQYRDFNLADVQSIQIVMCEGDDQVNIAGNIDISAFVDAGAGNDHVNGGGGADVILGGPGNDELNGGGGRDILIGGTGSDIIVGQTGDDLLIGGTTSYDGDAGTNTPPDFVAWDALLARWNAAGDVATRAANLGDDSIDGFFLKLGETVFDDGDQDELTGAAQDDWLWDLGNDLLNSAKGDLITS